jgi:benzylsuccinate CoA-transferase BbsF subunit
MEKKRVFEGVKVVDFTQAATGPLATKYLADNGATVIHIESRVRPDVARVSGPFKDNVSDPDMSAWFPNWSTNKLGITLNMSFPEAKEILWKLIMWGDVLVESFSPGVMGR